MALSSVFNPSGIDNPTEHATSNEYKVSYKDKKCTTGMYESIIRFIPNCKDTERNYIKKYVSWVKNPLLNKGMYVDNERTVGGSSAINDLFYKFWETNVKSYQDFAKKHLSTNVSYASLIQVVDDKQHPELVGKILVWKYGKKIYDKLVNEEHPSNPAQGSGINPFNPIYGRRFYIKCVNQGGFDNIDQCAFGPAVDPTTGAEMASGLWYKDPNSANPDQFMICTEQSDQQAVIKYLESTYIDLSKYDYQPMNAEQAQFVNQALQVLVKYLENGAVNSVPQIPQGVPGAVPGFGGPQMIPTNNAPQFPGVAQGAPAMPGAMPGVPGGYNMGESAVPQPPVSPIVAPQMPPQAPQVPQTPIIPQGAQPQIPSASPAPFPPQSPAGPMPAPQAPVAPAAPVAPVAQPQAPVAPVAQPQAPVAPVAPVAPSAPAPGPVMDANIAPQVAPAAPGIQPQVAPAVADPNVARPTAPGIGGDLSSVLQNL